MWSHLRVRLGVGVGELPTAWRVRALGAGILIKTDKRKMHVNVHFNWLLERIAGDIKQREKRGDEIKSFAHDKELQNVPNATSSNCFHGCVDTSAQAKPLEP